jgi:hypothetical protein
MYCIGRILFPQRTHALPLWAALVHCHRCVRRGHEQLGTIPARPAGLAKVATRPWISTVSAGSKTEVAASWEIIIDLQHVAMRSGLHPDNVSCRSNAQADSQKGVPKVLCWWKFTLLTTLTSCERVCSLVVTITSVVPQVLSLTPWERISQDLTAFVLSVLVDVLSTARHIWWLRQSWEFTDPVFEDASSYM